MAISVVIVDDEERGIVALTQLILRYCDDAAVAGTATNISDAADIIRAREPDVVFLDIEMPGGNGFQLLEQFDPIPFETIFVTAYQEYALKAIRFSALDYLLKPVKVAELKAALERVRNRKFLKSKEQFEMLGSAFREPSFSRLILSTLDGYYPVKPEDIIYCKSNDSYTHFYLSGGRHYLVSKNLKEVEEMLTPPFFFRVHKSYLININHIEKVSKRDGLTVHMSNKEELPVSVRRRDDFVRLLKGF